MSRVARFAYAQARLQSRYGARADERLWRRLASIGDFTSYLQAARRSTLRPWVLGIQVGEGTHGLERHLRQQLRRHVEEVAGWLPVRWRNSIRWLAHLADLPALQHLMNGGAAPGWMLKDPALRRFGSETLALRQEAMRNSAIHPLLSAWRDGVSLPEAWLKEWQRLWPAQHGTAPGLEYLARLLHRHLQASQISPDVAGDVLYAHFERRLCLAFRRYSFQPAAACAHLGLVALDLNRLRGELAHRLLFAETTQVMS